MSRTKQFAVGYKIRCTNEIADIMFDSYADLEKAIMIFEQYMLPDLENIINHIDEEAQLANIIQAA